MKGYLERMAASVAAPSQRLHPVALPMYAATPGSFEPMSSAETTRALDDQAPRSAKPSPLSPAQEIDVPDERAEMRLPVAQQEEQRELHARATVEQAELLLVQTPQPTSAARMATHTAVAESKQRESHTASTTGGEPLLVPEHAGRVELAELRQQRDVLPSSLATEARQNTVTPTSAMGRNAPRESAQQASRRATRAAGEDVQIHIGRIEVIAAAPQQAAARAAAPQKALRLDDYLKRRDRRSR